MLWIRRINRIQDIIVYGEDIFRRDYENYFLPFQFHDSFLLFYVVGYGLLSKRDIYNDFLDGARDGLKTVMGLVPTLIGLMTGVGILRASGFLEFLGGILGKATGSCRYFPGAGSAGCCAAVFLQRGNGTSS